MKNIFDKYIFDHLKLIVSGCIVIAMLGQSCKKKWLEAKVDKRLTVPETLKDFQAILDNYSGMNFGLSSAISEVSSDGHYYTEDSYSSIPSLYSFFQNAYTWSAVNIYETFDIFNSGYPYQYSTPY